MPARRRRIHVCDMRRRIHTYSVTSVDTEMPDRRRIHVCDLRRRIHVCDMRRRIHA
jgi:hypothetical protein